MAPFPLSRRTLLKAAGATAAGLYLDTATGQRASAASDSVAPVVESLPNGATLVTLPEPDASGVVWEAFFRVGLRDEGAYHGIRSLIARCWIGESKWRSAPLLAGDLQRAGVSAGTSCGADWAEIWGASGPDPYAVEKSAQTLFTNIIGNAAFENAAVDTARTEQMRAIALRRDDLLFDVLDQAQARAFGDSPYAQTPLGDTESLSSIPAAQAGAFYRRLYRPERAVFVAAGRITPEDAKRWVTAGLGAASWDDASPALPMEKPLAPAPSPAGLRDRFLPRYAPATCLAAAYLAPGLAAPGGRATYPALLVMDAALRGGRSSRLFALRDRPEAGKEPIGYEIRTVLTPGRWQSAWIAYVAGDRPAAEVRERLLGALHAVAAGDSPLAGDEIARAKAWCKARHAEQRQHLQERAFGAGWAETMGVGALFDADFDLRIDTVSEADVAAIAKTVLGGGGPAVVCSRPFEGTPG